MPSKSLYVLILGLAALFAVALLATLTLQPAPQQASTGEAASPDAGEAVGAVAGDAELAAQRELICVDRVMAGAIPEGSTVPAELVKCSPAAEASKPNLKGRLNQEE